MEKGPEDTSVHFLPRHKPLLKDDRIWSMNWCVQEVRSQTDYILGTDSHLFQNVAVQDARHNTNHYLVLRYLCGAAHGGEADARANGENAVVGTGGYGFGGDVDGGI